MAKHPDDAVPEREQLACTLWKCDYRAMDLLSGGDGFGDGSVTWNTLQPVDRMRWIATAQAFEDSHWLTARHDADIAAAKAAGAAEIVARVEGLADEWEEWAGTNLYNLDSEHRSVAKMTMVHVHALRAALTTGGEG